ncbi:unnamed protein product [Chrysodeixis includens]|uniref:Uncharacterized protein n=1 Tax=Chrysodeixis includens TaxID=689277 RepID=A0A9N8KS08_CHRIL|nr:unnamed protein product [Chrysodeixis includens]
MLPLATPVKTTDHYTSSTLSQKSFLRDTLATIELQLERSARSGRTIYHLLYVPQEHLPPGETCSGLSESIQPSKNPVVRMRHLRNDDVTPPRVAKVSAVSWCAVTKFCEEVITLKEKWKKHGRLHLTT